MAQSPTFRIHIDGVAPDTPFSALTDQQLAELVRQITKQVADRRIQDDQKSEKTTLQEVPDALGLENAIMLIRNFNSEVSQDTKDRQKKILELMHAVNKALVRPSHSTEE
jgi:hypothetical protein